MMVTFVSQCEKNAIKKTRQVLDAFADRIGDNTWQTVITEDGLLTVKKLLRQTASKSTAVSCHWIRSRSRSQFLWVVGRRGAFNDQGVVPVNSTQKNITNTQWENNWHYMPLIKCLVALAALLHNWGKASTCFQKRLHPGHSKKIQKDPLRHEWVSVLILQAFVQNDTDQEWLNRLANGNINEAILQDYILKNTSTPLANLAPFASLLAWLIVTHHRLPLPKDTQLIKNQRGKIPQDYHQLFSLITAHFAHYSNQDSSIDINECLTFPNGLLSESSTWIKQIKKWARKTVGALSLLEEAMGNGVWRIVLHHARLSLMLGDHFYSSQTADAKWASQIKLFANTDHKTKKLKQKLDEHLVGVSNNALKIAQLLPQFEKESPKVYDVKSLIQKGTDRFKWQDKAVNKIHHWREHKKLTTHHFGFFAINMASTGCGKTFANAKIMRALSEDEENLRYILALGLRTLTLQTGEEYRERIGLDNTELAVLIGSRAIQELHKQKQNNLSNSTDILEQEGSESSESLMDEDSLIDYDCAIPEDNLSTVLRSNRDRHFLYAPVLACTIDHIMAATETKRGGRYILPCLRLMSSDLVIDEIDDFDGMDLVAIGRIIHLAGMLGRKVMISSATIPPALAEGYFNTYSSGWKLFAHSRNSNSAVSCAWIDEFSTQVSIATTDKDGAQSFYALHKIFTDMRVKKLSKEKIKRKAELIPCSNNEASDQISKTNAYYQAIQKTVVIQHIAHAQKDPQTGKLVSFGVIRMANIKPCVELAEYLMQSEWQRDVQVRLMPYHSQQVLLMRSEQEKHLDEVLNRKTPEAIFKNPVIRQHIVQSAMNNLIFILVATPVEEVGRDHDFDWAVVEPSSLRSIIQLAGRVLRHRDEEPIAPNMAIMQFNLKGFVEQKDMPVFCRPGYETPENRLNTHDLEKLIDKDTIANGVNSIPRIQCGDILNPRNNLADLEHHSIEKLLTNYKAKGPETLQGWLETCWWLTALPQALNPFRKGTDQHKLYLVPDNGDEDNFVFVEKDDTGGFSVAEKTYGITHSQSIINERLWLNRDYKILLQEISARQGISIFQAALRYGEIAIPIYSMEDLSRYTYSPVTGLIKS